MRGQTRVEVTKKKVTIFIVDDDPDILESIRTLLEASGNVVKSFSSARQFLERYTRTLDSCLIADVRMPEMDGIALLKTMAEKHISLPTIMITGHGDVALAVRAMQSGAVDFIEKPFSHDTIVRSVERALSKTMSPEKEDKLLVEVQEKIEKLTGREREVFDNVVAGYSNKEVAHILGISPRTVENHRAHVMIKMEASSFSALVRMALYVEKFT